MTSASAPGKLFLSGEYAVLEGAPAVVTAVDRRVTAWVAGSTPRPSPVIDAVARAVGRFLVHSNRPEPGLPPVRADSSAFSHTRRKLGLGSSAAVAAAVCGTLFEWAGLPIDDHRDRILDLARAAHAEAQSGQGSGADVAVSVVGGTIAYTMDEVPEPISLAGVSPVFVWTGKSASTTELLDRIRQLEAENPTGYRTRIDPLIELAQELADAHRAGQVGSIVELTARYGSTMAELGRAAGAPIVGPTHERIAELAAACGGAAKPSGAGGGDATLAVFPDPGSARSFRDRCTSAGLEILDVQPGEPGLARTDTA